MQTPKTPVRYNMLAPLISFPTVSTPLVMSVHLGELKVDESDRTHILGIPFCECIKQSALSRGGTFALSLQDWIKILAMRPAQMSS